MTVSPLAVVAPAAPVPAAGTPAETGAPDTDFAQVLAQRQQPTGKDSADADRAPSGAASSPAPATEPAPADPTAAPPAEAGAHPEAQASALTPARQPREATEPADDQADAALVASMQLADFVRDLTAQSRAVAARSRGDAHDDTVTVSAGDAKTPTTVTATHAATSSTPATSTLALPLHRSPSLPQGAPVLGAARASHDVRADLPATRLTLRAQAEPPLRAFAPPPEVPLAQAAVAGSGAVESAPSTPIASALVGAVAGTAGATARPPVATAASAALASASADPALPRNAFVARLAPTDLATRDAALRVDTDAAPAPTLTSATVSRDTAPTDLGALGLAQPMPTRTDANAPSVPTPAQPGVGAPLGSAQWAPALGRQIMLLGSGEGGTVRHAELRLDPPDLGPLRVTLNLTGEHATAVFVSAHPAVRAAIEAALPQLQQALADAGIQLGNTSVGDQTAWQQAQDAEAGHGRRQGGEAGTGEDGDTVGLAHAPRVAPTPRGLVDTFA